MSIISRITRTTTTTETIEDTTPDFEVRSATPDFDFYVGGQDDLDDFSVSDLFDADDETEGDTAPQQALTVAVQLDGRPSGSFTYASVDAFARAVQSYGSYYSSAGEVTLTITKS